MICKTCGNECGDESICPFCGCNPNEEFGVESIDDTPTQTINSSATATPQNNTPQTVSGSTAPQNGMKWFKFTIYFSLWANMVLNIINAMMMFTGGTYGGDAHYVYEAFPSLKGVDVFFGVLYLGLAVFAVIVRFRLANFKKGSPLLAHILVGTNAGIFLLYAMVASGITGIAFFELISDSIGSIIGMVVLLIWNINYFNKRADLFTDETGATADIFEVGSPFPGVIKKLLVAEGTTVKKGQPILVLEAMKMDNDITADCDGIVYFQVVKGEHVEENTVLAIIA